MKINILLFKKAFGLALISLAFIGCQDMDTPALGDYPKDANAVGGPLKFYTSFDGNTTNSLMNAVDSIRAQFPTENPFAVIDGPSSKATQGAAGKFISFSKPNDFATTAGSFTIAFWEKHDGPSSGAEFAFSLKSSNGHWSGGAMFLLMEGSPSATAVKFVIVDKYMADTWLTWEGDSTVSGLFDNAWHHCAFVYDANTSGLTFYKDGVAVSTRTWGAHGAVNLDDSKITSLRIGGPCGSDGWMSSWLGGLDQFRMYSTALTAAEVTTLYSKKK